MAASGEARSLVSCDIGAFGLSDGSYPLALFCPWLDADMLNAGACPADAAGYYCVRPLMLPASHRPGARLCEHDELPRDEER